MTSGNSFVLIKTGILSSMVFVAGQLHHNRSCIPLLCSNMSHVSEEHSPGGFLEGTDMTTLDSMKKRCGFVLSALNCDALNSLCFLHTSPGYMGNLCTCFWNYAVDVGSDRAKKP